MKQVLQSLKTGETQVVEIPTPRVQPGHLLIATRRTLISAGTERMLVEFGNANLLWLRLLGRPVLSMGDYVRGPGATRGAPAAGGC